MPLTTIKAGDHVQHRVFFDIGEVVYMHDPHYAMVHWLGEGAHPSSYQPVTSLRLLEPQEAALHTLCQ